MGSCHTFDGKTVSASGSTAFDHNLIFHLASYLGQPLTVGSHYSHAKTEIMNVESGQWKSAPDYPFHSRIYRYATASTDSAAYIIGGSGGRYVSTIAEYKNNKW